MSEDRPNTTTIDFLPAKYRQRGVNRRTYAWRFAVAVVFAGLFVVTAVLQQRHHQQVRTELAEIQANYDQSVAYNATFAKVQRDIQAHRHSAELLTFLRHPWPRTGVIAAVLAPLGDGIKLTDIQISHETSNRGIAPSATLPEATIAPTDKSSRRASDLKRLLSEHAGRQGFVMLTGDAVDATVLHEYLAHVGANPLISKIDLRSIEHARSGNPEQATPTATIHFVVRAILRGPHGLLTPPKPAALGQPPVTTAQRGGQP